MVIRVLLSIGLYHFLDGTIFRIKIPFHFVVFFFFFEILPIIGIDIVKPNQSFQKLLRLISLFKIHLCNICHICNGVLAEGDDAKSISVFCS